MRQFICWLVAAGLLTTTLGCCHTAGICDCDHETLGFGYPVGGQGVSDYHADQPIGMPQGGIPVVVPVPEKGL